MPPGVAEPHMGYLISPDDGRHGRLAGEGIPAGRLLRDPARPRRVDRRDEPCIVIDLQGVTD